ncbi:MAG: NADH-quinone oxidoreductase subunit NuoH [Actinobacteria bacterium]|nr:NADH-quinone oxidoreductase subunit NuoH [Actinomycetota bacterium]
MTLAVMNTNGDPLYWGGVHWAGLLITLIKVVVGFAVCMGSVTLMIWFLRKAISDMQSRIGPNRVGPFGLLQTLADGIKLFFKEDLLPENADPFVFKLAPYLSLVTAFLTFAIVPVGGTVTVASHTFELQVADPPIGILLMLAMSGISVYGVMLAGWASGSKYPLLSSVRSSAQMISYEAALGMLVVTVVMITGSLSTRAIVDAQAGAFWHWNLIRLGVVPFFLFFIAITAEINHPPFDVVEAESELVSGFNTEYSSIRFALFYLAEFLNTITMSAIMVTLFFGGPAGPVPHIAHVAWVFPILWFLVKVVGFAFAFVWIRAALPRFRYDQVMELGWKRLIPLSLAWMLLVAGFMISATWGIAMAIVIVLGSALLGRSFLLGDDRVAADRAVLPPVGARPVDPADIRRMSDGGEA